MMGIVQEERLAQETRKRKEVWGRSVLDMSVV